MSWSLSDPMPGYMAGRVHPDSVPDSVDFYCQGCDLGFAVEVYEVDDFGEVLEHEDPECPACGEEGEAA